MTLGEAEEIWAVDFEFIARDGERPDPVCLVAREVRTGRMIKQWRGGVTPAPPFRIDHRAIYVSYYASAELGCHLALGWPMPANVLDLFCEFRNRFNGLSLPVKPDLIGALTLFGLDHMTVEHKNSMRDHVLRGGPWDAE